MSRYPKYKDSGIDWIGEIPEHWGKTRLKYIGYLYSGLTGKSGEDFKREDDPNNRPFINFTNICNNTYITRDNVGQVSINEGENQNRVEKGDLFFLMSSETQDDVGKSSVLKDEPGELYLNSFCKGFRLVQNGFDPNCINYILTGDVYRKLLSVDGKGFTRINLRQDKVNDFIFFCPPIPEQLQIVDFLDQKTTLLDTLIKKKHLKIELLKEQRISIINQTVTRGLNPNVRMKDSEVEWISVIPEEWGVVGFTKIIRIRHGYQFRDFDFTDSGIKVVKITQLDKEGFLNISNCSFIDEGRINDFLDILIKEDDILMCLTGGTIGKIIKVGKVGEPLVQNYRVGHFSPLNGKILNDYLFWFMSSDFLINQIFFEIRETGQPNIGIDDFRKMKVFLPTIPEQEEIIEYLKNRTKDIDTQITLEYKKIDLLKEYRQSLISEVVTGKIDVRKN